ncbi:MAG TPA: hypothetical protein VMT34_04730, partial [Aggregatilineales bacterium]|nr:hypothetical protein [Aggregatilineales bacterium]
LQSTASDDDSPIHALKRELTARKQKRDSIEKLMEQFCERLYTGFEAAVARTTAEGVPGLGKPRRIPHPASDWRQALQLFIEDWSVIIVPLVGAAWPNPRDEARITPYRFKEPCGRIALFIGDDPNAESFYDFLVFADGYWFAWGYGWPRTDDDMENTNFEQMTLELLTSFVKDIHATWRPRRVVTINTQPIGTQLNQSLDVKKRAYNWGLPGDE